MGAGQIAAQRLGLLHGVDRRVREATDRDAQLVEAGKEVPGGGGRRAVYEAALGLDAFLTGLAHLMALARSLALARGFATIGGGRVISKVGGQRRCAPPRWPRAT